MRRRGSDLPYPVQKYLSQDVAYTSSNKNKDNLLAVHLPKTLSIQERRGKSLHSNNIRGSGNCYLLPVNEHERDRLNRQHEFLRISLGAHFFAPVHQPRKVLDVGTGTGIWIKDMAKLWPTSRFYGMDLVQPEPQNGKFKFKFAFADIFKGLPYSNSTFDYVHQRFLSSAIPTKQWKSVLRELYRVTRPGGYLEITDATAQLSQIGPATSQLFALMINMLSLNGIDLALAGAQLGDWLEEAGFELVKQRVATVPIGEWGGEAGCMSFYSWCLLIRALKEKLLISNPLRSWDFELLMTEWQAEIQEIQTSFEMVIYVARRPEKR
ncbi:S-adenosyl-L-methionine-dependent methyltransferase [Syncephalis fuscata]|nr:S-adenosyl-L-methionine-dependent methyltransferase [Syncephalis fuscata]